MTGTFSKRYRTRLIVWLFLTTGIDILLVFPCFLKKEAKNYPSTQKRYYTNTLSVKERVRMENNISLLEAHDIATEIERKIKKEYGEGTFINIHMEPQKTVSKDYNV